MIKVLPFLYFFFVLPENFRLFTLPCSAISTWEWGFLFGKQQWSFKKIKNKPQTSHSTKLIDRFRKKTSWKQPPNFSFVVVNMFNKLKENCRKKILDSGPQTYTNSVFWMISILWLLDGCYKTFKTLITFKRAERLNRLFFLKFNSL